MELFEEYAKILIDLINEIKEKEKENILKAANVVADALMKGKIIHAFGPGHGRQAVDELFFRAGGLVPVNPIYDPGVSLEHVLRCVLIEQIPGYIKASIDYYNVNEGDVAIIANYVGVDAVTIDAALEFKRRNATTIGISSAKFCDAVPIDSPMRHPSKKNLYEIVDIFIDTHAPPGDAVLEVKGLNVKVAPVTTVAYAYIINSIVAQSVKILVERGAEPPIWLSTSLPGAEEHNRKYIQKYYGKIKHL